MLFRTWPHSDYIYQMITLTVITLSGFHCIRYLGHFFFLSIFSPVLVPNINREKVN